MPKTAVYTNGAKAMTRQQWKKNTRKKLLSIIDALDMFNRELSSKLTEQSKTLDQT